MTQPRWERCVQQRGEDVQRFIAEFLGQKHRRVLVLGGAGFDPRSTLISRQLDALVKERTVGIFLREERPGPSSDLIARAEANVGTLRELLGHMQFETVEIFAEDGAVVGGRRVAGLIEGVNLSDYTDLIVDFSSLSKGITFPAVRHIMDRCVREQLGINVHLMVADEVPTDIAIQEVGSDRAVFIAGFEGGWWVSDTEFAAKLWLPQLIHQKHEILNRIFQFVSPDDVCPILPFPAANPRLPDLLIEEYGDELESIWEVEPRDLIFADESDPLDLYRTILRIDDARTRVFKETGGSKIVLSPLGSKVLTIGALMAALERDFPVVYVEAVDYQVDFERIAEGRIVDGEIVHIWLHGEAYAD